MQARERKQYTPDDLVEVTWRGRPFLAVLVNADAPDTAAIERPFKVEPITPNISARFVDPDDVTGHWKRRKGGRATARVAA